MAQMASLLFFFFYVLVGLLKGGNRILNPLSCVQMVKIQRGDHRAEPKSYSHPRNRPEMTLECRNVISRYIVENFCPLQITNFEKIEDFSRFSKICLYFSLFLKTRMIYTVKLLCKSFVKWKFLENLGKSSFFFKNGDLQRTKFFNYVSGNYISAL